MEKLNELIKDIEAVDNMYLDKKNVLKALKIAKKEISKQLLQTDVSQQCEQLIDFLTWYIHKSDMNDGGFSIELIAKEYLKSINCG